MGRVPLGEVGEAEVEEVGFDSVRFGLLEVGVLYPYHFFCNFREVPVFFLLLFCSRLTVFYGSVTRFVL